jgi:iron-sulfur cluster repair protein YtfE (RIC family)
MVSSQISVRVSQALRDEHRAMMPAVQMLCTAAHAVGDAPSRTLRSLLSEVDEFLTQTLLPHAHAEECTLYPAVARMMGAPEATVTMSRDHVEIERLVVELAALMASTSPHWPTHEQEKELRRVLYGLYALVRTHFAKEDEVYLPMVDARLTPAEAALLMADMDAATQEARNLPSD